MRISIHEVLIDNPINPLTYDEFHALVLGSVGFWIGRMEAPSLAVLVAAHSILDYLPDSAGGSTISREPWYFNSSLLVFYLMGRYT